MYIMAWMYCIHVYDGMDVLYTYYIHDIMAAIVHVCNFVLNIQDSSTVIHKYMPSLFLHKNQHL